MPDHLTAVVRSAHALAARGDLRGAQTVLEEALEPTATVLGPDHPEVLAGTRLLASLHRDLGDLTRARRLLEEAIAAGLFTLGEDSPALLPLSYDLAVLADELGNRHEARRNFTTLLRHGPAALGPDHEYVRAARRYLEAHAPSVPPPSTVLPVPTAPLSAAPRPQATPAPPTAPPPTAPPPAPGPAAPVLPPRGRPDTSHSRAPMLVLVLVAAMALMGGGIAAYLVLHQQDRGSGAGPRQSATAAALLPPGALKLRDDGSSVTLSWTDPTNGTVPFVVAGGRADNVPNAIGSTESGKTAFTINGLNTTANYCFLVAAVYSPQHTVPSALVCTGRNPSSGRPSAAAPSTPPKR